MNRLLPVVFRCAVILAIAAAFSNICAQKFDGIERERMKVMLGIIKGDIKKNYYDPTYRGIDLDDRFKKADERLDQVKSTPEAFGVIAQALIDFNDSHLYFVPPSTNIAVEYGWRMLSVGNATFVTAVKPDSDAEKKGLKVGDQIISVGGFKLNRNELWKLLYYYNTISKRNSLAVDVQGPGDPSPRHIEVLSEIKKRPQAITFDTYFRLGDDFYYEENYKHRFYKVGNINVWQMPDFDMDTSGVASAMGHLDRTAPLIIDLRGNGGGYVKALEELAGYFFDRDVQIAELKGRKKLDPMVAKSHGTEIFAPRLVVLVDSQSASAAEIFARLLQLEKRATVIGDRSSGSVMQAIGIDEHMGSDSIIPFRVSVTNADVIMSDGKSLEHEGVTPDELILPTASDLAADRDPVLAKAVELLGGHIDPAEAGKMTTYYWK